MSIRLCWADTDTPNTKEVQLQRYDYGGRSEIVDSETVTFFNGMLGHQRSALMQHAEGTLLERRGLSYHSLTGIDEA